MVVLEAARVLKVSKLVGGASHLLIQESQVSKLVEELVVAVEYLLISFRQFACCFPRNVLIPTAALEEVELGRQMSKEVLHLQDSKLLVCRGSLALVELAIQADRGMELVKLVAMMEVVFDWIVEALHS